MSIDTLFEDLRSLQTQLDTIMASLEEPKLEKLWSFRELEAAGYGNRNTLTKLIKNGTLPAVRVAGAYKVFDHDLEILRLPVEAEQAAS